MAERTIGQAGKNACQEPFAFLAEVLRVVVLCVSTSGLHLIFWQSENALPLLISQGDMYMSIVGISNSHK